jgi:hypothetical protein
LKKIISIFILLFLNISNAQNIDMKRIQNDYINFINGRLDKKENCLNPEFLDTGLNYKLHSDGKVSGRHIVIRDGKKLSSGEIEITRIEVDKRNPTLLNVYEKIKRRNHEESGDVISLIQFDGSTLRVIERSIDGKKTISDGRYLSTGTQTIVYYKCDSMNASKLVEVPPGTPTKEDELRSAAKIDVISQALNYSIGVKEDSSGKIFYAPINNANGRCIYRLIGVNNEQSIAEGLLNIAIVGNAPRNLDINKGNPEALTINSNYIKDNLFNRYDTFYSVRIEGIPGEFQCSSTVCNPDRLYRAWNLIFSKCSTVKKPF